MMPENPFAIIGHACNIVALKLLCALSVTVSKDAMPGDWVGPYAAQASASSLSPLTS